ncbi:hypothetical protein DXZ20_04275 [Leptolyngbyaceae cyanobacterium CCMR0081]|uniref:Uncharacterized protein n=1 Tax=Adonisia turfae CCMR0081 TaxID=2292702 RepID=A0A6M0RGA0_9CYAN|nr:hypothetical protein [Adonisia turfae CCMR0081]
MLSLVELCSSQLAEYFKLTVYALNIEIQIIWLQESRCSRKQKRPHNMEALSTLSNLVQQASESDILLNSKLKL